ncbi:lysophospholipid acyltransferase family protein [Sphingomicrobium sediminis]|uniref:Lysophospholipid acyltransferase family protein n=1 Tax=Sphingomicrobium sediminis TaxID=2950949 RepID=A0A9X2EI69_9SPHN|nr:lysophospholipid acyltransferase family protein [Sphingomicrobium sediminis]MCM8558007.1 lysophospholipid acyltransferase family protein [Sphingomicrobium sediminis]
MGETSSTNDGAPVPWLARFLKWAVMRWWRLGGWKAVGTLPESRKFIIAGAPHTSNWDFLVFLGVVETMGLKPRYIGKHTLFKGPLGGFMKAMGGVPVDRTKRVGMVGQVAEKIRAADEFALVIAIEGTRSPTTEWKSGFYRIAMEAGIPIVCAGPDYIHKLGIIGPIIHPTGDFEADMEPAYRFFKGLHPRHPKKAVFPDGSGLDPQLQAEMNRALVSPGTAGKSPRL